MQIVLLSPGHPEYDRYPSGGGIQHQIYHTAKWLDRMGHEPIIIKRDLAESLPSELRFESVSAPFGDDIVSVILYGYRARERIRRIRPDVVILHERFSALFPSRVDIPAVFVTHNLDAMEFYRTFALGRHPLNRVGFPVKKRLEERLMHTSEQVVALTPALEQYLHDRGIDHTTVVPNAVEPDEYTSGREKNYIFYAGRLNEVKGCRFLIRAFADISTRFSNVDLLMAGKGEESDTLRRLATELGIADRVRFLGWIPREELQEYYANCLCFVLPSLFETFGIVVLEAMASGKPVIATDIPGPNSIIEHGEDGVLVEPRAVDALSEALQDLLSNEQMRRRVGERAREKVIDSYSFSKTSEQLCAVCKEVTR